MQSDNRLVDNQGYILISPKSKNSGKGRLSDIIYMFKIKKLFASPFGDSMNLYFEIAKLGNQNYS